MFRFGGEIFESSGRLDTLKTGSDG